MGGRGGSALRRRRSRVAGLGIGLANPANQQDDTQQAATQDNSQQGNPTGSDADAQQRFVTMDNQQAVDFVNSIQWGPNRPDLTGLNRGNELQTLIAGLGMHEKPTVLSDNDFDQAMQTEALDGVTLYRGVTSSGSMSGEQVADQIKFGDKTYIGDGIHGDGIYFTTRYGYANMYASNSKAIVQSFIDKNKAVVITEKDARAMHSQARRRGDAVAGNLSFDAYALYRGYNVIHVPGGNADGNSGVVGRGNSYRDASGRKRVGGEDYYVPLTRSVLVIREHTKKIGR